MNASSKNRQGDEKKTKEEQKAADLEENIKRVESITSQASENAKTAKNMTIFFKNYSDFIGKIEGSKMLSLHEHSGPNLSENKKIGVNPDVDS